MTRREILIGVPAQLGLLASVSYAGKEFWNSKTPAEWSDDEKKQLLNNSPWAREIKAEMNTGGMGAPGGGMGGPGMGGGGGGMGGPGGGMGGPGMGGGGGMGGPGGGMGGPGMGGGGGMGGPGGGMGGTRPEFKAVIRWESAEPVRALASEPLPEITQGHYVISVSGMPPIGQRMRRGGEGQQQPDEDRMRQMADMMKENTRLVRKGKDPIHPANIIREEPGGRLLFLFSPEGNPITVEDKEVTFETRMGPMQVKSKFKLKDMLYRGKLAV